MQYDKQRLARDRKEVCDHCPALHFGAPKQMQTLFCSLNRYFYRSRAAVQDITRHSCIRKMLSATSLTLELTCPLVT